MMVEMICAGFGGQGVLTTGLILAEAGMKLGMNVLWYPSYGSEMRGGTANCTVKFSDKEIASPCAKKIDILMGMNAPAIDKFESSLRPGGLLLVNSSLVHEREYRDDIRVVKVPMTEIAAEHENPKGANIVMMGAMAANSDLFTEDDLERLINEFFEKKGKTTPKTVSASAPARRSTKKPAVSTGFCSLSSVISIGALRRSAPKIPLWRCKVFERFRRRHHSGIFCRHDRARSDREQKADRRGRLLSRWTCHGCAEDRRALDGRLDRRLIRHRHVVQQLFHGHHRHLVRR